MDAAIEKEIADALLLRKHISGSDGAAGERVLDALAMGIGNFSITGTTLTVNDVDGSELYTTTITRSAVDAIISAVRS